jgi:hypothetical protein
VGDIGKTENLLYNVEKNDVINHAALKEMDGNPVISFGPGDSPKYDYLNANKSAIQHYGKLSFGVRGTNKYPIHGRDILLRGVNKTIIKTYGKILSY